MATPTFILPSAPTYTEGFVNGLNVYPNPTNFVANQVPFTRATTATRTNAAGLIELVPYNLFTYSEQFDNANWSGVDVSVTADTSISPSGLLNADTINITSSSGYRRNFVSTLNSSNYTFSAYVKKSANTGTNLFRLYYNNNIVPPNNGEFRAVIDLTNLTITTTPTGTITTGRPTIISSNLTSVGNGWYRAEISFTTGTAAASTGSEFGFQSNGTTAEFLAWGAQFVEGTNALPYQQTATRLNRPRVDFSLGGCPNLLLEPQRTNTIRNSTNVGAVVGTPGTLPTNWSQYIPSLTRTIVGTGIENGLKYIDIRLSGTTTDIQSQIIFDSGISTSASVAWTQSAYLKLISGTLPLTQLSTRPTGTGLPDYGTIITVTSTLTRFFNTFTLGATATAVSPRLYFNHAIGTAIDFTIRIAGTQLELGAYPTTYIPTTSATVTRNSDSFTLSNVFTNNLISSAGGTWFVELRNNRVLTRDTSSNGLCLLDSSLSSFGFRIKTYVNARLAIAKVIAGGETGLYVTTTDTCKIAIKWNGTTADIFENGVKVIAATAFTSTNMEALVGVALDVPKYINDTALYNTPISDAECIQITTL
jgi:hypothetical protein